MGSRSQISLLRLEAACYPHRFYEMNSLQMRSKVASFREAGLKDQGVKVELVVQGGCQSVV